MSLSDWVTVASAGASSYYVVHVSRHAVLGELIFRHGNFERAARWLSLLGFSLGREHRRTYRLAIAEYSGATAQSVELANDLAATQPQLALANACVNAFINAGQYSRAIQLGAAYETASKDPNFGSQWGLLQTNLAEAEYNLGQWDEALARIERVLAEPERCDPLATVGAHLQQTWVLAYLGRCAEARASFGRADEKSLPPIFRAEYHYTNASLALAEGESGKALEAAQAGLAVAKRASSKRNGFFLRARVLVAIGETAKALEEFERAAAAPYRAQGGDGLLAWGDLLHALGRDVEARIAWQMAVERDPESHWARTAQRKF